MNLAKQDPARPGRAVKQEQEQNSRNHVQAFLLVSVQRPRIRISEQNVCPLVIQESRSAIGKIVTPLLILERSTIFNCTQYGFKRDSVNRGLYMSLNISQNIYGLSHNFLFGLSRAKKCPL